MLNNTNQFKTTWKRNMNDIVRNPLLRTYNWIKTDFIIEPYLNLVKNYKYRKAISKLRASSHTLEIERGRYTNPSTPIPERLCSTCNVIEDEVHFLTECDIYKETREHLYSEINARFPDFQGLDNHCKFNFMLCFPDERLLSSVGKFIHNSFMRRDQVQNIN